MGIVVPNGYSFVDTSDNNHFYTAGQVFNGVVEDGDYMNQYPYQSTGSTVPHYTYYAAHDVGGPIVSGNVPEEYRYVHVSAGWRCECFGTDKYADFRPADSMMGQNVVQVMIFSSNSYIKTLSHIPRSVEIISIYQNDSFIGITDTPPSTLKGLWCYKNTALTTLPSDLSHCTNWFNAFGAFQGCTSLTSAPKLPSSIKYSGNMFQDCSSLTSPADIPSSCIDANNMYNGCTSLPYAPYNNSDVVENLSYCFRNCTSLISAENFLINAWTSYGIFNNCPAMTTPPTIANKDLNLSSAFLGCSSLTSLPTVPANVRIITSIFEGCSAVVNPPAMYATCAWRKAFDGCSSLISAPSIPNGVTDMSYAFRNCSSLTVLPQLPESATVIVSTFENCIGLVEQNYYIPESTGNVGAAFKGCTNLKGIFTFGGFPSSVNETFEGVSGPIIVTGNLTNSNLDQSGPNVHIELDIGIDSFSTTRCSDTNGTLSDDGQYCRIIVHFTTPVPWNSDLYVPKVYLHNAQQEPVVNWKFTNDATEETIVIPNSTDISEPRIHAGDLVSSGSFEGYVLASSDSGTYKVFIPSSADDVYATSSVKTTKYWSGVGSSAIYTGDTFIFDAIPDGSSFKIGGSIDEENETGFIVGNRGLPILADQYPSTFNGPVSTNSEIKFNDVIFIDLSDYQESGTADKKLYDAIRALGWEEDVLSS